MSKTLYSVYRDLRFGNIYEENCKFRFWILETNGMFAIAIDDTKRYGGESSIWRNIQRTGETYAYVVHAVHVHATVVLVV